jgi:hypothetical protein
MTNSSGATQSGLTWALQDGASSDFELAFSTDRVAFTSTGPTSLANNATIYVRVSLKAIGKPIGTYNDVLLIGGTSWAPGYLRKMVNQSVEDCNANACSTGNLIVTTNAGKASFTTSFPVNPVTGAIPLTLSVNVPVPPAYDPSQVRAFYTIATQATFDLANAVTPVYQWTPMSFPLVNNAASTTTANLSGLPAGTYYIHWYVEYGTMSANSGTPTTSINDCKGFGPYTILLDVNPGTISGPSTVCNNTTATLTSVTAATGGTGTYS